MRRGGNRAISAGIASEPLMTRKDKECVVCTLEIHGLLPTVGSGNLPGGGNDQESLRPAKITEPNVHSPNARIFPRFHQSMRYSACQHNAQSKLCANIESTGIMCTAKDQTWCERDEWASSSLHSKHPSQLEEICQHNNSSLLPKETNSGLTAGTSHFNWLLSHPGMTSAC